MNDANIIQEEPQEVPQKILTREVDGKSYPLFPFDQPVEVTLTDGTTHRFRMWDEQTEKKRERMLKSVVVTSPAVVHGENPRDVRTDFSKAALFYYNEMIDKVAGFGFTTDADAANFLEAQSTNGHGDTKIFEMIPAAIRKAAANRLYAGKIESLAAKRQAEAEASESDTQDVDPFSMEGEVDISKEIEKVEKRKTVHVLTLDREIVIRQELGSELLPSGRYTDPTHVIDYTFREPDGADFSLWEMKGSGGFAITLANGGTQAERFFNLDTIKTLFNRLILRIEGASLDGREINIPSDLNDHRKAITSRVPLLMRRYVIANVFQEAEKLGNF
jgi:hypothetical protein